MDGHTCVKWDISESDLTSTDQGADKLTQTKELLDGHLTLGDDHYPIHEIRVPPTYKTFTKNAAAKNVTVGHVWYSCAVKTEGMFSGKDTQEHTDTTAAPPPATEAPAPTPPPPT